MSENCGKPKNTRQVKKENAWFMVGGKLRSGFTQNITHQSSLPKSSEVADGSKPLKCCDNSC